MKHEWDYPRGRDVCVNCHCTMQQVMELQLDCPGPKPAGNTGRHEVAIGKPHPSSMIGETAESDGRLWDRLRADLANLGTDYLAAPATSDKLYLAAGKAKCCGCGLWVSDVAKHVNEGFCSGALLVKPAEPVSHPATRKGYTIANETDRNLYYDGIILAARKKREEFNWAAYYHQFDNDPGQSRERMLKCLAAGKEQEQSASLSDAMARPLSFPKRIGWKPGDCE